VKIWVVGAGGLLGASLMEHLAAREISSVGTTRKEGDICHLEGLTSLAREIKPTHIVNCAAYTDVDGAEKDASTALAVNAEGAAHVALVAQECSARLVHISTDYVFNGLGSRPYVEEDPCDPINVYGTSKWTAEKLVLEKLPTACVLRTSWIFGQGGKNFISSLLKQFQQKEEVHVVSDQRGRPTYCRDLAEAIVALLDHEGIIHFANEGVLSRYQIALDLLKVAQEQGVALTCQRIYPASSEQFPSLAARPSYSVLSTEKYAQWTAMRPRRWDEVIREYVYDVFKE
jgi:dTDP-4-dehydrorhamnose reductase